MTKPPKKETEQPRGPDWPWWMAYVVLLLLIAGGMFGLRAWMLQTYGGLAANSQWQEWKEDATQMEQDPRLVKRRAPKSVEPPGLVLARDHFAVCFAGGMVLAAVLLGVTLLMFRGAFSTNHSPIRHDFPLPDQPQRRL
jgi:hypothetical protein